ncbi:MAG: N-6 DNA methylase [Deltaproteobacteria bacterium]|nr:N-6 DNA methylase [Deltaproteobacteria bacterium]
MNLHANNGGSTPLGQVFTPPAVADLVLALALEGLPSTATVLDPACGDGVFLKRARVTGISADRLHGIELCPAAAAKAVGRVPGAHITCGDFFEEPPRQFDAVVGNPPYVRQEFLDAMRKRAIARQLREDWPEPSPAPGELFQGRADLAMAFVARALRFARPGGRVAFVLSQAVLDADYGRDLERFLVGRGRLVAVIASIEERWFLDAAIHAAVVVLERTNQGQGEPPLVARLRVPVAEAARVVRGVGDLARVADLRPVGKRGAGVGSLRGQLRAPGAWLDFAAAAGELLVPLSDLADVRRGVTSGQNSFFYLSRVEAARKGIEPRFLVPLLRSPKQAIQVLVDPATLPTVAFQCDVPEEELAMFPGASAHVASGTKLAASPSLSSRARWWSLPARPARLFLTKAYDERFVQVLATAPVIADQRMYAVDPRGVDLELLAAVLNSTCTALALEALGRASMGDGALEWSVGDARNLPVLDVRRLELDLDAAGVARDAFRRLSTRAVGRISVDVHSPERQALDGALLSGMPHLRALLAGARDALVGAVATRLAKALSPRSPHGP